MASEETTARSDLSISNQRSAGFRRVQLNNIDFTICSRYELVEIIGQGAYGVVAAAKDLKTGEMVAIKKMQHTFEHSTFTKRTLRELRILRNLQHENIVRIRDINTADGERDTFDEIYVVCDLMETDLGAIIKSDQPLCDEHFQFFLYQLLRGLKYCHSAGVIHRDLKPRNLLVNANCDLRICDFGLARVVFPTESTQPREMTEYVATRWYRAPEILWAWSNYGAATDVWSAGCILAELLGRAPLFPGRNTQHQLKLVISHVGTPTEAELRLIPNARCREFILSLPSSTRTNWSQLYPNANVQALDLLDKMLKLLPQQRISIEDALAHPYFSLLHHIDDEPTRSRLDAHDFLYEQMPPNIDVLREEIWREAHPELYGIPPLPFQECTIFSHQLEARRIAIKQQQLQQQIHFQQLQQEQMLNQIKNSRDDFRGNTQRFSGDTQPMPAYQPTNNHMAQDPAFLQMMYYGNHVQKVDEVDSMRNSTQHSTMMNSFTGNEMPQPYPLQSYPSATSSATTNHQSSKNLMHDEGKNPLFKEIQSADIYKNDSRDITNGANLKTKSGTIRSNNGATPHSSSQVSNSRDASIRGGGNGDCCPGHFAPYLNNDSYHFLPNPNLHFQ